MRFCWKTADLVCLNRLNAALDEWHSEILKMLKVTNICPFVFSIMIYATATNADVGVIAAEDMPGCDYFVVETINGYSLLEWYGGTWAIWVGDKVYGDLNSYGFTDIEVDGRGEMRVWVDDFWMSRSSAAEHFFEKCD